ncbi:hypothetical protein [Streptomyces sp. NPDC001492]
MRSVGAAVEPCPPGDGRPVVGAASTVFAAPRAAAGAYLWSDRYRVRGQFDAAGVHPVRKGGSS